MSTTPQKSASPLLSAQLMSSSALPSTSKLAISRIRGKTIRSPRARCFFGNTDSPRLKRPS